MVKEVKAADTLILATDPDREGEAISWHILEALKEKKALGKVKSIQRVTFHEITKKSILDAVAHPRDIDMDLVQAQPVIRLM
jgi:DNA topoisomerase-1